MSAVVLGNTPTERTTTADQIESAQRRTTRPDEADPSEAEEPAGSDVGADDDLHGTFRTSMYAPGRHRIAHIIKQQ